MKSKFFGHFLTILLVITSFPILSLNQKNFSPVNLPQQKDYAVIKAYKGESKPLSFESNKAAKQFKTILIKASTTQPNFADYYIVVPIGCGTMCQQNWIINVKTGKIIGPISSELGVSNKIDSKLLITNPIDSLTLTEIQPYKGWLKTEYYLLEDDKINKIYSIETIKLLSSLNTNQKKCQNNTFAHKTIEPQKLSSKKPFDLKILIRHDLPTPDNFVIQTLSLALTLMTDNSTHNLSNKNFLKVFLSNKLWSLYGANDKCPSRIQEVDCISSNFILNTQEVPRGFIIREPKQQNNHWIYRVAYLNTNNKLQDKLELDIARENNEWRIFDINDLQNNTESKGKGLRQSIEECLKSRQ